MIRIDHLILEEYERFDYEEAQKVMDKESHAHHQHRIAMHTIEMAEESDAEQDVGPEGSLDPAQLSDLPPSAY
eukprot:6780364-Karenia_brevis.AAC.2